jgi:hypothetical protein
MKVYVESIFVLDFNKKMNFENEEFILNYDFIQNNSYFNIEKKKLNEREYYILHKKRSYGYEIYLICPDYLSKDEFDGVELIEKDFESILSDNLKTLFKNKYENYKGEYLFHQHIFNYFKDYFDINEFLKSSFEIVKIDWSKYIYKSNLENSGLKFSAIYLLSIDNFILQRHVMYEYFSREYLLRMGINNICFQIKNINNNIDFLNKSRWLVSQHKLIMENFKTKVISYIEENKLFHIHRVIRKREIFEKIKEDFSDFIATSQENLNNILMIILTLIGIFIALCKD